MSLYIINMLFPYFTLVLPRYSPFANVKWHSDYLVKPLDNVKPICCFVRGETLCLTSSFFNRKISEADDNLSKFLTHLTTLLKSTRILKLVIENTQRERQQNVWNLIANVKENENENEKRGEKKSESVEKELKNCPPRSGSCTNGMSDIPDKSNRNSVLLSNLIDDTKFPNKLDALTIINDNNHLRYR